MRLGGPIMKPVNSPDEWVAELRRLGYTAAYCPDVSPRDAAEIAVYRKAAEQADIWIAEVGAWSNPISTVEAERRNAIRDCQERLAFADEIGALCCVNIAGSRGAKWDGPHPDNFSEETFAQIVDTVREIIDTVKPRNACYALETMPWIFPDSAESYERLIRAIDRRSFAVHLDPVNLISSPRKYFDNAALIRECFRILGPYIKSCHAKDIILADQLTVHLSETRPGLGNLDYRVFIEQLRLLGRDVPLMLEHLNSSEDYRLAAEHIRVIQAGQN